jgi:acyl-CoA thioester hydrolase
MPCRNLTRVRPSTVTGAAVLPAWIDATNELMLMHIDHHTRRGAPWRAEIARRLDAMARAHAALPRPDHAGRVIAIRRKAAAL